MSKLFYNQPAAEWEQALPIGCGRLGAMVYGGVEKELIQLNEENMWLGGYTDRINPDAREALPKVRAYLSRGEAEKAERLMDIAFSGCPDGMRPYQTLGEIQLHFGGFGAASKRKSAKVGKLTLPQGITGYRRELDLNNALCSVSFTYGGTEYKREFFASHPRDCIIMRFTAEGEGTIDFTARLRRGKCFDGVKKTDGGVLLYGNLGKGGSDFAMELRCSTDVGEVKTIGECLCVSGAKTAVLYFTAVTDKYCTNTEKEKHVSSFFERQTALPDYLRNLCGYEKREYIARLAILNLLGQKLNGILTAASSLAYGELLTEHIKDYTALYNRCALLIGGGSDENTPTDIRLQKFKEGAEDDGLYNLLFDYGRYLTIACSREGGLPATLQGIWNKEFFPPWDSKYTININTEMNYWHVETCNLSECHQPLFDLIEKIRVNGRRTAREMYGCRGFVAHHNTDAFGDTAPQDTWYAGTYWVMGGAWLATHLWEHFLYTQDIGFLKEMFPVMAEAALFLTDFLVEKDGYLVISPSVSPENSYVGEDGDVHCCCEGAAMDNQIARELFSDCINAWNRLKTENLEDAYIQNVDDIPALMQKIEYCSSRLKPDGMTADGRIMEWNKDYKEAEAGHRHLSHLFALYPGRQISPYKTPELAAAAEKTIDSRLAAGSGYTGWSRAWIINLYAALHKGAKAYKNLREFLCSSVYPNMFDRHPPFQIDGNFGVCAAICQMIVQSGEDELYLLPALPEEWRSGELNGAKIVGNAEINIKWNNGILQSAEIKALSPYSSIVCYNDKTIQINLNQNETIILTPTSFQVEVITRHSERNEESPVRSEL